MSLQQSPMTQAILKKTLAGAAAMAALAHGPAAAAQATGLLARGPLRTTAVVAFGGLALLAMVRVLLRLMARRADSNQLDPASELTTLTFPPTRNPRPPRAK
ncbi:MAG: hypothetical protein JWP60_5184 [Ramlibacter sp.]|nr:hypothetical protein [Ramlibacter sp.]